MTRLLAGWVEITATMVLFFVMWKMRENPILALPMATWWGGVSAGVLALYGAKSVTDKKLNGRGE